jgi:hypothetical protein
MNIKDILGSFIAPVADVFKKREERKLAQKQIEGKLAEARINNAAEVMFPCFPSST